MSNLKRLRQAMAEKSVPALLLTDSLNIQWLSGFTGSTAITLVTPTEALFITDSRYTIQAHDEVSDLEILTFGAPTTWTEILNQALEKAGAKTVAFETTTTIATGEKRKVDFPQVDWTYAPDDLLPSLRMVKTPDEVEKIRAACKLADACLAHTQRLMQVGVTEFDINLEIEFFYRRNRADLAFEPIVVSGPNSAKPHGRAGERKLQPGDFVTIDCGARLNGYCSDITRTFIVGEPTERHKEIYNQVLRAEVECCQLLKPGADAKAIDQHARDVLAEKDLAQYFGHGLGHGLGLYVHDPGGLSKASELTLAPGMVFTVEPGVYIEGFGGVRIEDDVLITESGPEILTTFPKELTVVG